MPADPGPAARKTWAGGGGERVMAVSAVPMSTRTASGHMTNKEIARILYDIAGILEIKGESVFRVIAYRNAARSVEFLAEDIYERYRRGGRKALDAIPGVGTSIALKIEELVQTGRLKYYDQITKTVPTVELELTKIPNVGPKTAAKLYETLKVKSVADLERSLDSPRAAKYFKQKTRDRIKRGIALLRRLSGRMLLPFAEPIAREFVEALRRCPGVSGADPVGSLRRMRDTVGDIDIVCAATDPAEAIERFVTHPDVKQVLARGDTKATIIHAGGVQMDLEILPRAEYGSLLQHFTGSKEHNIALRTWGVEHGFSISEHGIKRGRTLHAFAHETEVYKFLGMDWIPPELRENRGEIEAALHHRLPALVEARDIRGDLQGHSTWSDGRDKIDVLARTAVARGYEYLAITDHTKGLGVAHGLDAARVAERHNEIETIKRAYRGRLHLLEGLEVDIRADGRLDLPDEILERMDIVVASIHSAFAQPKAQMTARLVGAIENPHVDILGHPSGRLLGEREEYPMDWTAVFTAAAAHGVALEINAFPNRLDLSDVRAREAHRHGALLVIDTDFHRAEHLDMMRYGVAVARRAWLTKADVLNTRSWPRLSAWLARRQ
ncbi:MAG TPA: DNA polymerase/3'-5' exonuclease PolX [bacterium]|nr:DNA polymerase/3'-5' exonuclease PolX [bacterium]